MSTKKAKLIRKAVRRNINDDYRRLLTSLLDSPVLTRLKYALIIIFRLGYRDLVEGNGGAKRTASG